MAQLDRTRPVLILTRAAVRPYLKRVTVAPITSTVRGLSTEVPVGRHLGYLLPAQESALAEAILAAYDLEPPE